MKNPAQLRLRGADVDIDCHANPSRTVSSVEDYLQAASI